MALHVDCATCPAKPRACGDCSVGYLLGPVMAAPPVTDQPQVTVEPRITEEPGLQDAIVTFANAGMLPGLRVVPEQGRRAG